MLLVAIRRRVFGATIDRRFWSGSSGIQSAMLLLLLLALYNINVDELVGDLETLLAQRRRQSIIAWTLGVAAIAERFVIPFEPSPLLYLAGSTLWLLLFAYITWNELRAVLKQREVISMSISVYLLFGLTFGSFLYRSSRPATQCLQLRRRGSNIRAADDPGSYLLQPNYSLDHRVWRHHSANSSGPLCSGGGRHHGAVLLGDPGCAAGRNADEPIRRSASRI